MQKAVDIALGISVGVRSSSDVVSRRRLVQRATDATLSVSVRDQSNSDVILASSIIDNVFWRCHTAADVVGRLHWRCIGTMDDAAVGDLRSLGAAADE